MNKRHYTLCATALLGTLTAAAAPEASRLFEKFTDPQSGVVSYLLKPGLAGYNQQGLYYTQQSMTDDGRFLVFSVSPDEWTVKGFAQQQHLAVADLATDQITVLTDFVGGPCAPALDTAHDTITYMKKRAGADGVFRRRLAEPLREEKVCNLPDNLRALGKMGSYYTHLTFSHDRAKIFLDMCAAKTNGVHRLSVGGTLELATGIFREWYRDRYIVRHADINPVRDDLALALKPYGDSLVESHDCAKAGACRRLMLYSPGKPGRMIVPPVPPGGTAPVHVVHTAWTPDGTSIYWCSYANGVILYNVETGAEQVLMKENCAVHCALSPDGRYLAFDEFAGGKHFRGQPWKVGLYDRVAKTTRWIFTYRPPVATPEKPSRLHPDPHPNFAQRGRYVVSTFNCDAPRRMTVALTPMAQMTEEKHHD